jgi:hypothetical protein
VRLGIGPKLRRRWPLPSWVVAVSEGRRRCHIVCAVSPDGRARWTVCGLEVRAVISRGPEWMRCDDCVPCFERYWGPEG